MPANPKCSICGEVLPNLAEMRAHSYREHPAEMAERRAARKAKADAKQRAEGAAAAELAGALDTAHDDAPPAPLRVVEAPQLEGLELEPAKRTTWRDRLWNRRESPSNPPEVAPAGHSKERKPKVPKGRRADKPRVSTAKILTSGYSLAGFAFLQLGDAPVGRAMLLQADTAGPVLEALTKDTFVDGPLQFLAEREEAASAASALLGLPVLVFLYERATDDLRTLLEPLLVLTIKRNMVAMAEAAKKAREEEAAFAAAAQSLGFEGADPVQALVWQIFGMEPEAAPAPDARAAAAG